jgi:hypothetical protein
MDKFVIIPKGHKFRLSRRAAQLSFKVIKTALRAVTKKGAEIFW